jgi:5-methylcytosine-specific restriction endonuclease McrA
MRGPHPGGSSWISRERRIAIYVRDSWTCQVCLEPVLREHVQGDDRSPSLDHIEPQSHTLIPDHSDRNLRTACLLCNNVRNDARLTDAEVRAIVAGRRYALAL